MTSASAEVIEQLRSSMTADLYPGLKGNLKLMRDAMASNDPVSTVDSEILVKGKYDSCTFEYEKVGRKVVIL